MVEATADLPSQEQMSTELITDGVRKRIGSLIIQSLVPVKMPLPVMTLNPELEALVQRSSQIDQESSHPLDPELVRQILAAVEDASQPSMMEAKRFAIVTSPSIRRTLLGILRPRFPETPILSFEELPEDKPVEVIAIIGGQSEKSTADREPASGRTNRSTFRSWSKLMSYHDKNLASRKNYNGLDAYGAEPASSSTEKLVTSHLPLVRKLAWHVHGRVSNAIDIEDFIQIGMVALVEAAQNFEDRGLGFSNYAKLRVRGAMIDHLRKLSNLSRSAMVFRKQLGNVKEALFQKTGHPPDEAALAKAMGMDAERFRVALDQAENVELRSMDEVYSDQNIWFEDNAERADESLERKQMQAQLEKAIRSLPEREGMILQLYFVEEMNLDEIGKTMDIGAARVCQIKKVALEKLRMLLKPEIQC